MCSNIVAMSVLTLALSAARASAAACHGDPAPPKITTNIQKLYRGYYTANYREKLEIHCSGEDNVKMKVNGQYLKATVNTTIQLKISPSELGRHVYSCIDSATDCEVFMTVVVRPALSVRADRAQYKLLDGWHYYFVPHGEEYQVLCSAPDGTSIQMENDYSQLQTVVVNSTTSVYTTRADRVEEYMKYQCRGKGNLDSEEIMVTVDYYPQCEQFRCVIHDWEILECKWRYPTDRFTFNLFYTDHNDKNKGETPTLLCHNIQNEQNITCKKIIQEKGHNWFSFNQNISLLLSTCYKAFCYNETFDYNTNSLIKLNWYWAPGLISRSSHDIILNLYSAWYPYSPSAHTLIFCDTCVYRVEYRLNSTKDKWRQADTSDLRCNYDLVPFHCNARLTLPYPDSEYEVRMSTRHRDSVDNRLWLDPQYVYVRTEPRASCVCPAFHTPAALTVSTEAAKCDACRLTEDAIKRNIALKNKIKSYLQKKRTKIDRVTKFLSDFEQLDEI